MKWIPSVTETSLYGTREVLLQTKLFEKRTLFLTGEINECSTNDFILSFLFLSQTNEPINIIINSTGGVVTQGLVIYDLIQNSTIEINLYCVGIAASMAAVILASGKRGHRFVAEHSKIMIHEPSVSSTIGGSASNMEKAAKNILETKSMLNEILSKHTGQDIPTIESATCFDNFLSASEAIEFGIVDEVRSVNFLLK